MAPTASGKRRSERKDARSTNAHGDNGHRGEPQGRVHGKQSRTQVNGRVKERQREHIRQLVLSEVATELAPRSNGPRVRAPPEAVQDVMLELLLLDLGVEPLSRLAPPRSAR